jgi:hypothetical protein
VLGITPSTKWSVLSRNLTYQWLLKRDPGDCSNRLAYSKLNSPSPNIELYVCCPPSFTSFVGKEVLGFFGF